MTRKRRYLISAAVLAMCVFAGCVAFSLMPTDDKPGVTKANFDRVAIGMTKVEVDAVLRSGVEVIVTSKKKAEWVGREVDLLVEGESEETELLWEGRTILHAPEIDGKVFINDFGPHETLVPGTFYRAEITESHDYDVVARILT